MEKYIVVIEKSSTGFSAFSPDAPGCITVGETVEDTIENMREALDLYIEASAEAGAIYREERDSNFISEMAF